MALITDRICTTLEEDLNIHPRKSELWKGLRHKDVLRKMRDFFWKVYHGAQKIGKFWRNMPRYKQ